MTPATFEAVVYKWSHERHTMTVFVKARTPNRFHGDNGQIDQLVSDFNCIDGARWADTPYVPEREDLHPEADEVPPLAHEVCAAVVRPLEPNEIDAVLADQHHRIQKLRTFHELHPDHREVSCVLAAEESYLRMLAERTVAECHLAPPDLPEWVADQPAVSYLLRAVDLVLRPFPDRQLLNFRETWWPTWA